MLFFQLRLHDVSAGASNVPEDVGHGHNDIKDDMFILLLMLLPLLLMLNLNGGQSNTHVMSVIIMQSLVICVWTHQRLTRVIS